MLGKSGDRLGGDGGLGLGLSDDEEERFPRLLDQGNGFRNGPKIGGRRANGINTRSAMLMTAEL